MTLKKIKFCFFVGCLFLTLFWGYSVSAKYTVGDAQGFVGTVNQDVGAEQTDVMTLAARILRVGFGVVGIVFFIFIFYASFLWLIAKGKEEQIEKARNIIIGSSIGLIIIVGSYAMTNFVFSRVAGNSISKGGSGIGGTSGGETPTGPLGCCLNEIQVPGGYWDQEITPVFYESVTDENICKRIGLTCSETEDALCGEANWEFFEGISDPAACAKVALKYNNLKEGEEIACDEKGNCK